MVRRQRGNQTSDPLLHTDTTVVSKPKHGVENGEPRGVNGRQGSPGGRIISETTVVKGPRKVLATLGSDGRGWRGPDETGDGFIVSVQGRSVSEIM
jgi:hypothetical protein